jgi:hypothetical protein
MNPGISLPRQTSSLEPDPLVLLALELVRRFAWNRFCCPYSDRATRTE